MNEVNPNTEPAPDVQVSRADMAEAVRATSLLADLSLSMWSGEKTDRDLSEEIKRDKGAVGHTGRFVKNLLAGCDTKLKEVRSAYASARVAHYQLTLPWVTNPQLDRQSGARLLPNALFERYLVTMSRLKQDAEAKLRDFLADYPSLVQQAQANLAGMANADDYPSLDEVRAAFRLSFDFEPIPAATAFQGLPDSFLAKLGDGLRRKQEAAVEASQAAMWARVRDAVGHLAGKLADKDARFKESTLENVRELIGLLPGFNAAGDPRVAEIVSEIGQMLQGIDAKDLRRDERVRADVAARANAIGAKLGGWNL